MREIVLGSGNPGKLMEFSGLLKDCAIRVVPQSALGVPEVGETGLTFVENALLKARNAARHTGLPALADDSGLEVDALHGAPGIYSARYAGSEANDADNIARLLRELADVPEHQRCARFQCLLVYVRHTTDPTPLIVQGTWEGRIAFAPRGAHGFGYDPIFYVPTLERCAAELDPDTKNRVSHRGQALSRLLHALRAL
jgi:non-canonical purine NTP pyrophosphatase, rdgB/HAM1 family